jgi:hypothetical protein
MENRKWYEVAKILALSDSIAEGYNYCDEYTVEDFEIELKQIKEKTNMYGNYAAVAKEILDVLK